MEKLIIEIPSDLKQRLRVFLAKKQTTAKAYVTDLIEKALGKEEEE